jgi:RNA-binding protein
MPPKLTGKERRALRAKAHAMNPAVTIGSAGLSAAVLAEADRALDDHELVKVKIAHDERDARKALVVEMCASLNAEHIQSIGKTALIYRLHESSD